MFFSFWTSANPEYHLIWKKISFTSSSLSGLDTKIGRSAIGKVHNPFHSDTFRHQNFSPLGFLTACLVARISQGPNFPVDRFIVDHLTRHRLLHPALCHANRVGDSRREYDALFIKHESIDL